MSYFCIWYTKDTLHHVKNALINIRETKGAIKNGQSRETGNNGYTRQNKKTNKTKHNTIYVGHHRTQDTSYTLCHMLTCPYGVLKLCFNVILRQVSSYWPHVHK